jgi:hypothetical protein
LKLEQQVRGKFGFETRTKTRSLSKESRGRLLSTWSHSQLFGQFSCEGFSISQMQSLFKRFVYFVGLFLDYLIPIQNGTKESYKRRKAQEKDGNFYDRNEKGT